MRLVTGMLLVIGLIQNGRVFCFSVACKVPSSWKMYGKAPSNSLANRPSSRAGSCNSLVINFSMGKESVSNATWDC